MDFIWSYIQIMEPKQIQLKDGRRLGYRIYGSLQHQPVLYYHGTPSSSKEPMLLKFYGVPLEELLKKYRLQLIAVDRPGMGYSDFHPDGSLLSFANDVYELLLHLNIERCHIMAWSGGGPYALATAFAFPGMIGQVSILCGFTRRFDRHVLNEMGMNRWYFRSALYLPAVLRSLMYVISGIQVRKPVPRWITRLPEADHRLISTAAALGNLSEHTMKEACRSGTRGAVHEARGYFNNFGFPLADIAVQVHFWWGTEDGTVTKIHAKQVEEQIRHGVVHYKKGEGHLSLYVHCFEEVLQHISTPS
jgi:pimeloyl-ACP methyl ester carboxylesterase